MKKLVIIFFMFFTSLSLAVELRTVEMSWAPIQGAEQYEFKLFKYSGKTLNEFKSYIIGSPSWNQQLAPGEYSFQIRSLDYREVPGLWSDQKDFSVKLPSVNQTYPVNNEGINLLEEGEIEITFRWDEVKEATQYNFRLVNNDNKVIPHVNIKNSFYQMTIDSADSFLWKVTALGSKDSAPKTIDYDKGFIVHPPKLEAPEINLKVDKKHLTIAWTTNSSSNKEIVTLYRKIKKKWKQIYKKTKSKNKSVSIIKKRVPRGKYKVKVYAFTETNDQSKPALAYFDWDKSDLLNVKNETAKSNSNDNFTGKRSPYMFGIGFSLLDFSFDGSFSTNNTKVQDTITGQRFHLWGAYSLKNPKHFLDANFSISELVNNTESWILFSIEAAYNYRIFTGKHSLNLLAGPYLQDLPYVSGSLGTTNFSRDITRILGIKLGTQYKYFMHRFWKAGFKFQLNTALTTLSSPSDSSLSPSVGQTLSLFTEYWIKSDIALKAYVEFVNAPLTFGSDDVTNSGMMTGMQFTIDL